MKVELVPVEGVARQMVDPLAVDGAGSTHQSMDFIIAASEQKFCQIGTILTCNAGDESLAHDEKPLLLERFFDVGISR
jgi:hypothetical protein